MLLRRVAIYRAERLNGAGDRPRTVTQKYAHRMFEMQKLWRRLRLQRAAMDQTMIAFEELMLMETPGTGARQRRTR